MERAIGPQNGALFTGRGTRVAQVVRRHGDTTEHTVESWQPPHIEERRKEDGSYHDHPAFEQHLTHQLAACAAHRFAHAHLAHAALGCRPWW